MRLERTGRFLEFVNIHRKTGDLMKEMHVENTKDVPKENLGSLGQNLENASSFFEAEARNISSGIMKTRRILLQFDRDLEKAQEERLVSVALSEVTQVIASKEKEVAIKVERDVSEFVRESYAHIKVLEEMVGKEYDSRGNNSDNFISLHKKNVVMFLLSQAKKLGNDVKLIMNKKSKEIFNEMESSMTMDPESVRNVLMDSFDEVIDPRKEVISYSHISRDLAEEDKKIEDAIIPEEFLLQENLLLEREFEGITEKVTTIEKTMEDIEGLQQVFSQHLVEQEAQLKIIDENTSKAVEDVEKGNKELHDAYQRGGTFGIGIATFVFIAALCVLFLDWYG